MGRYEMRVSDEWLAMLDEARGLESRASFIKRAVAEKIDANPPRVTVPLRKGPDPQGRSIERQLEDAVASVPQPTMPYRCPDRSCEWKGARSPAASCPHHGRRVVEA